MAESSSASSSSHLLHKVGRILESEHVDWGTIGALAVAYHGLVRASLDADALIALENAGADLEKLAKRLRTQGWRAEVRRGDEEDPLGFVIRVLDDTENQVDLIGGIRRLDPGFFKRVIPADVDGLALRIASPEDLLALKVFAGGSKDIADAAGVLEIMGSDINRELLLRLCRRFGPTEEKLCIKLLARLPGA